MYQKNLKLSSGKKYNSWATLALLVILFINPNLLTKWIWIPLTFGSLAFCCGLPISIYRNRLYNKQMRELEIEESNPVQQLLEESLSQTLDNDVEKGLTETTKLIDDSTDFPIINNDLVARSYGSINQDTLIRPTKNGKEEEKDEDHFRFSAIETPITFFYNNKQVQTPNTKEKVLTIGTNTPPSENPYLSHPSADPKDSEFGGIINRPEPNN